MPRDDTDLDGQLGSDDGSGFDPVLTGRFAPRLLFARIAEQCPELRSRPAEAEAAASALFHALARAPDLRDNVVELLVQLGGAGVRSMISALRHEDETVREVACLALARSGTAARKSVDPLVRCLADLFAQVRSAASEALSQIGAAAVPALVKVLRDEDRDVREGAMQALSAMGSEAESAFPDLMTIAAADLDADGMSAGHAAASIGASAVPRLLEMLRTGAVGERRAAVFALGSPRFGAAARPAAPAIAKALLDDFDRIVRRLAAEALCEIGPEAPEVVPALARAALSRLDRTATAALGQLGPAAAAAVPALRELIAARPGGEIEATARWALRRISPPRPRAGRSRPARGSR